MTGFSEFETKAIEKSIHNNTLKKIDMPEISRDIYRDYVILWKDLKVVCEKYKMTPEKIKLISTNVAALIGDYEKNHISPVKLSPEDIVSCDETNGDVSFE